METVSAPCFRVLGCLEVRVNGQRVEPDGPRQRVLLIALLQHANNAVAVEQLFEWLWPDGEPPHSAPLVVQSQVSRLRRLLEPERGRWATPRLLLTRAPGYLMRVGPEQLDLLRFADLVARGREQLRDGEFGPASRVLTEALGLWRGPAFADLDGIPAARAAVVRWEELRLFAAVMRVEADLELGQHLGVIAELEHLVDQHPFDERLYGLLMLALYRSHRLADALATYRRLSANLDRELRVQPAPALRRLYRAVLGRAPELDTAPPHTLL